MLDPKTLEEIGNKMSTLLANSPAKDLEKNAKAAMSGLLAKLRRRWRSPSPTAGDWTACRHPR